MWEVSQNWSFLKCTIDSSTHIKYPVIVMFKKYESTLVKLFKWKKQET